MERKETFSKNKVKAFSLIELLVTMAIISILMAMLATSAARAKEAGQRGACIANTKNIELLNLVGVSVIYAQDYEYPYWSPYEGKEGYVEINQGETVLFVNCFDCHDGKDPFNPLHELITVY